MMTFPFFDEINFQPGLPDFSWCNIPKSGKTYQMTTKLPN
jgi:hypothetical protein